MKPKPRSADEMTESQYQTWVIERAKENGWRVCHIRRGMIDGKWLTNAGDPGFPDLVLLRPPQLVFLELKRERGAVVADRQVEWIGELQQVQEVEAYIVRPTDFGDVLSLLAPID
jgi:hypothetical protein